MFTTLNGQSRFSLAFFDLVIQFPSQRYYFFNEFLEYLRFQKVAYGDSVHSQISARDE